jgi:hypothetical protein
MGLGLGVTVELDLEELDSVRAAGDVARSNFLFETSRSYPKPSKPSKTYPDHPKSECLIYGWAI